MDRFMSLSIGSKTKERTSGLELGLSNYRSDFDRNKVGVQVAAVQNWAMCKYTPGIGLQIAPRNKAIGQNAHAAQIGIYNNSIDAHVAQTGIINDARGGGGVQAGIINRARWFDGVQLGLVCIAGEGDYQQFGLVTMRRRGLKREVSVLYGRGGK